MTWWQQLITYSAIGVLYFAWGYLVRMRVEARRARKARRELQKALEGMADGMARAMGYTPAVRVDPEQIKTDDRIHWHDPDSEEPCVEYTAGFNGDTGNQTAGTWYRKDA
jgi:hypothetical protein